MRDWVEVDADQAATPRPARMQSGRCAAQAPCGERGASDRPSTVPPPEIESGSGPPYRSVVMPSPSAYRVGLKPPSELFRRRPARLISVIADITARGTTNAAAAVRWPPDTFLTSIVQSTNEQSMNARNPDRPRSGKHRSWLSQTAPSREVTCQQHHGDRGPPVEPSPAVAPRQRQDQGRAESDGRRGRSVGTASASTRNVTLDDDDRRTAVHERFLGHTNQAKATATTGLRR